MSNTPLSDTDYINTKSLAGLMRAFDFALAGKQQAHVMGEEFRKVNAEERIKPSSKSESMTNRRSCTSHAKKNLAAD